jgi:hypothetical protein
MTGLGVGPETIPLSPTVYPATTDTVPVAVTHAIPYVAVLSVTVGIATHVVKLTLVPFVVPRALVAYGVAI